MGMVFFRDQINSPIKNATGHITRFPPRSTSFPELFPWNEVPPRFGHWACAQRPSYPWSSSHGCLVLIRTDQQGIARHWEELQSPSAQCYNSSGISHNYPLTSVSIFCQLPSLAPCEAHFSQLSQFQRFFAMLFLASWLSFPWWCTPQGFVADTLLWHSKYVAEPSLSPLILHFDILSSRTLSFLLPLSCHAKLAY